MSGWDLAQQYFVECLGIPEYVLSGCGLVNNMLKPPKLDVMLQFFDEVSKFDMQPGDVCIWEYGHIAIFDYYDGTCYYFSQNYPLNSNCHLQGIGETDVHAFRLKKQKPPVTPNVARDENKNQIKVKVTDLNVRKDGTTSAEIIGVAKMGYYDYYETKENDGYTWYRIDMFQWVAYKEEWIDVLPAKPKDEYVQLKVLDKKDGYALVDLGKVWVKQ